jgi:hypothetical protein
VQSIATRSSLRWRDAHAVAQHIALVWDLQALNYGAVRLGGKAGDPRF